MKKSFFSIALLLFINIYCLGQNVGIGTTSPTAQLHTTGTVRHAILNGAGVRPVFADANGNLIATLPALPPSSATNNTVQAIPDISCTGVTSINNLSGLPTTVQSASILVTVNITHPRVADLSIYLTAPGGAIINLLAPSAALAGANLNSTVFTDAGILLSSGAPPYTGQFKPLANMTPSICGITPTVASFTAIGAGNMNPNGAWNLRVIDNTATNTGSLTSWSVSVISGLGVDGLWNLKGNSGTNAFNFIGTTDNQPLRFRVNNLYSGLIDTAQNTFFGYQTGAYSMKGKGNTGIGNAALAFDSSGSYNTSVGSVSLLLNYSGSYNTAIGEAAMLFNQTGNRNTAIGWQALFNNFNGNNNVGVGNGALHHNSGQSFLVAVGDSALYSTISGSLNTAVGSKALFSNTAGANNTAQGFQALFSNVDGNWNTAIGTNSMRANTNGFNNTSVGSYSLLNNTTGNQNAALGSDALHENKGGSLNTALGLAAMYNNISGYGNTATGFNSLVMNTTGSTNTANGYDALFSNTTGNSNIAIGVKALYSNTTQSNLVGIGDSALFNNAKTPVNLQDGTKNTAIGSKALFTNNTGFNNSAVGHQALFNNSSGSYNTAVGMSALNSITSGSGNTAIGAGADIFNGLFSNSTAIGAGAIASGSNTIKLGNNNVTDIQTNNNANLWIGNLFVKGYGNVRNSSSLQLKVSSGTYVVSFNIAAFSTVSMPFSYNETFSTIPSVYVGNITGGPGGFAEVVMSIANATTTGATLFIFNPRNSAVAPNFTVKIIAMGGE